VGQELGGLSARAARRLPWSICGLSLALMGLGLFLASLLYYQDAHTFDYLMQDTSDAVAGSAVGAVIASRRPESPIGWILCSIGLFGGVDLFCAEYASYALSISPAPLPGSEVLAWVKSWLWVPGVGLFLPLLLLFPNGRLPSRRWRPFAWLCATSIVVGTLWVAFSPGPIDGLEHIDNPLGIRGLPRGVGPVQAILYPLALVAAGSSFVRLRNSSGEERQQIKWFTYAATVAAVGAILAVVISPTAAMPAIALVGFVLFAVGAGGIPIAMGVAILRYRLYEIDLLINRTLVYGSLTATLVALYVGSIVLLQRVFVVLTGEQSTLAVVASTLLIAALFNPLRRRIQGFIDRRFYRRKYDARKTLEDFSAKLRDETDLEEVNDDLVGVVRETMQPAHISLWLRPETASKGRQGEQKPLAQGSPNLLRGTLGAKPGRRAVRVRLASRMGCRFR
jgi:hypothetical protein